MKHHELNAAILDLVMELHLRTMKLVSSSRQELDEESRLQGTTMHTILDELTHLLDPLFALTESHIAEIGVLPRKGDRVVGLGANASVSAVETNPELWVCIQSDDRPPESFCAESWSRAIWDYGSWTWVFPELMDPSSSPANQMEAGGAWGEEEVAFDDLIAPGAVRSNDRTTAMWRWVKTNFVNRPTFRVVASGFPQYHDESGEVAPIVEPQYPR